MSDDFVAIYNNAGAGVVIYNNKIVAHKLRLMNYFELISSKTM